MEIVYALTDSCNGNCHHCYRKTDRDIIRAKPVNQCCRDVVSLKEHGHKVIIGGSENLTNPAYLEVYRAIGQDYLLSNGIVLARDASLCHKMLAYGITKLYITWNIGLIKILHSISEKIVLKAIKNAHNAGLKVVVECVIGSLNCNSLSQIIDRVLVEGAVGLKLFQLLPTNLDLAKYQLRDEQRLSILEQVKLLRQAYPGKLPYISVQGSFDATSLTEKRLASSRDGNFCPAGRQFITIETDDCIYPCPFLSWKKFRIGSWKNGKIVIEVSFHNNGKHCAAETIFIPTRSRD